MKLIKNYFRKKVDERILVNPLMSCNKYVIGKIYKRGRQRERKRERGGGGVMLKLLSPVK